MPPQKLSQPDVQGEKSVNQPIAANPVNDQNVMVCLVVLNRFPQGATLPLANGVSASSNVSRIKWLLNQCPDRNRDHQQHTKHEVVLGRLDIKSSDVFDIAGMTRDHLFHVFQCWNDADEYSERVDR